MMNVFKVRAINWREQGERGVVVIIAALNHHRQIRFTIKLPPTRQSETDN